MTTKEYIYVPHWMWAWKSGHTCDVCGRGAVGQHKLNDKIVGYFCKAHFPADLSVTKFSRPCVVCGKESTAIARSGLNVCNDHLSATQEDIPPSTLPETTAS